MKRDLLTSVLALILLASAMAAAAMYYKLLRLSQQSRALQETVVHVNQHKAAMNQFLVDLNEYGLRNPALNPLLDQMKFRLRSVTNAIPIQK